MRLRFYYLLTVSFAVASLAACSRLPAETVTFEGLLPGKDSFYNGNTGANNSDGWTAGGVDFSNNYFLPSGGFGEYWDGWSYSNVVDQTTPGFGNQYAAAPGGGSDGLGSFVEGDAYGVGFGSGAYFNLPTGATLESIDWTNGTYSLLSMTVGDTFAKKFGGVSGDDPDFFRAILTGRSGLDGSGSDTGAVTLDLADFTFADNSQDFIVDTWQVNEDLSALGNAQSVSLSFESSDVGAFGINTPQFLFVDNLRYSITAIPEPTAAFGLAMFSAIVVCRRRRSERRE